MYFDAVLDSKLRPVFNGTPEEVKAWLVEHKDEAPASPDFWSVCYGKTLGLVSVEQYLDRIF